MAAGAFAYRLRGGTSDSDSDSSDGDREDWKRATERTKLENLEKIAIPPPAVLPTPEQKIGPNKRKRNNIWSDVLEDQMMSETLNHCGIKNKPKGYGSRGEESYDYTLKYKYSKRDDDSDKMSEDGMSDTSDVNSVTSFRSKKYQNSKKFVQLDGAGIKAAKKIVHTLGEKKSYLIFRVVKHIGIEKAMQLLKETEEIEENGGMMIKNQQRRRTPGGVYFQLLKSDKDVTKAAIDQIFEGELNSYELKKKSEGRRKKKKLEAENKKKLEAENKKKLEAEKMKLLQEIGEKFEVKQEESGRQKDSNLEVMEEVEMEETPVPPNKTSSDLEDGEIDD